MQLCDLCLKDQETNQIAGLTKPQWQNLAKSIRDFILTQEKESLEHTLQELTSELVTTGAMSLDNLRRCIYAFYETVST